MEVYFEGEINEKDSIFTIALLSAILVPTVQKVYAATRTIDGVVSDTMCGRKHMFPAKTDEQCTRVCIKDKASYALVTDNEVYTLVGKARSIAPFAGKHVQIKGESKDKTIDVTSIHEMDRNMKM
jgi:hypothetical protein